MQAMALAGAGMVLLLAVGVGIVAHELSHAAVLSLFGIQCTIAIGPGWTRPGQLDANTETPWAVVTPKLSPDTPARAMRLASIAPLCLAVPLALVVAGTTSDPVQADSLFFTAWTVGWLACAIPSPTDFSVFWHADRAVAEHTAGSGEA